MIAGPLRISYTPYVLQFKEPGGTSRGVLTRKLTYFLKIEGAGYPYGTAYGEIPLFEGLSIETRPMLEARLKELIKMTDEDSLHQFYDISSLVFGVEQALGALKSGNRGIIFGSDFTRGTSDITINGLIWMGKFDVMKRRVEEKLKEDFGCIKIKIGAIDWEEELKLLRMVREIGGSQLTIRVDANGAFSPEDCLKKLDCLSRLNIHSIEQPIKQGNLPEMKKICSESPIAVALDEELIGIPPGDYRSEILEYVNPAYIILKPALCYGFSGASDWIERASKLGIDYWITSALESSVGLDAIAQYTGSLSPSLPQGLGTGKLYTNNFKSPLSLNGEKLTFRGPADIYYPELDSLP